MAWVAITSADIEDRMAQDEIEAIEETGGGTGDRMTGVIAQVVSLVRGKVSACDKNTLGASGTIPEECKYAACTLVRHALRAGLPSYTESETEMRRDEYNDATAYLNSVAACEVRLEEEGGEVSGSATGCYGGDPQYDF